MYTELSPGYGNSITTTCPMCHRRITIEGLLLLPFAEHWDQRNLQHFTCCNIVMAVYLKRERGAWYPPTLVIEPEN